MKLLLAFTFLFFVCFGNAQEQAITKDTLVGLVVNSKGKPIKNLRVLSKVSDPVSTNKKGIFVIVGQSRPDTITLVFSPKVFFQAQVADMSFLKFSIDNKTLLSVNQAKEEIINIGYGSLKKSDQTTSSSSITGDELRKTGEVDLVRALVGKVPGLQTAYLSDGTLTLKIRGGTTINEDNNSPLFIVDGSIVDNPSLINVYEIEKVDVLKDGSMYGSRGANGAVIVVMKH